MVAPGVAHSWVFLTELCVCFCSILSLIGLILIPSDWILCHFDWILSLVGLFLTPFDRIVCLAGLIRESCWLHPESWLNCVSFWLTFKSCWPNPEAFWLNHQSFWLNPVSFWLNLESVRTFTCNWRPPTAFTVLCLHFFARLRSFFFSTTLPCARCMFLSFCILIPVSIPI